MRINESQKVTLTVGQLKRLVSEAGNSYGMAYISKLNEILPKDVLGRLLSSKNDRADLPKFNRIYAMGEGYVVMYIDENHIYDLILSNGRIKLVKDPTKRELDRGQWRGKTLWENNFVSVDKLYEDATFAKAICEITNTKLFERPGTSDRYLTALGQILPRALIAKGLDGKMDDICDLGRIYSYGNDRTVKIYPTASVSNYVLKENPGVGFILTRYRFSQEYQQSMPQGKPKIFNAKSLDELYQNVDFAKEVMNMKANSRDAAARVEDEKREEANFTSTPTTIYFKTYEAALLFNQALQGQISDGKYENSKPDWHWKWLINLKYDVDSSNKPGYEGPSHKMVYDCRVGLRDDRAITAVWFGKLISFCAREYKVKFDAKYLPGLIYPVYRAYKRLDSSGEGFEKLTMDDFQGAGSWFEECVQKAGFGDRFIDMIVDGMYDRVNHGTPNPANYYDEAYQAMNSQLDTWNVK